MLLKSGKAFCYCMVLLLWWGLNVSCDNSSNTSYLPPDVKICSAKDPKIDECFTNSANKMLKHLADGIPRLNAVQMEPLHFPLLSLERNNSIFPSLAFNISNTVHRGWKDVVVLRSKVNPNAHELFFVLYAPQYFVGGKYEITGSIIGIPTEGTGDMDVYFENCTLSVTVRGRLEDRNGEEYYVIVDAFQHSYYEKFQVDFKNLFNNTALTAVTNKVINYSYRPVLDALTPAIDQVFAVIYGPLAQRIFDRVPYRQLFTDLD
ncbi:hypothetical protein R5R35_010468 [Gryllus longicercus]|uniref:Juvenile hormone binding protein n=2 Tax=Gryllus longicercus TaxID=2509291 RepID=A0AAN9VYJ9_9ORTH